jgi:hypothetical protein
MKPNFNLMKQFPLFIAGIILFASCSTYDKVACPDLSNNRSYSKKYMADNRSKKNLHKNRTAKDHYYAFRIYNGPKYKTRNSRDYTINQDKSLTNESSQIKSVPGITEIRIPSGKDEKFELLASSGNSLTEKSTVPSVPDITNSNKNYIPAASAQDLSNLTRKEQREMIKPFKKELKSAIRSYGQTMSGQEAKPAMGFAVASIICGIVGLFIAGYILGLLAIIFGGVALRRIRNNPGMPGRGLAYAGIILGLIDVILLAILMLALGTGVFLI